MKQTFLKFLACLAPAAILVSIAGAAFASEPEGYKIVGGTVIYFAVVPAEIIRGHPKGHSEATMHGGVPDGKHIRHLMVALFEAESFDRIADAEVKATVTEIGLAGKTQALEPFTVADALTYGNYFEMRSQAIYRIKVTVRRPGAPKALETVFEYTHR